VSILLVIDYIHCCILLAVPIDVSNATVSGLIDGINKYKYKCYTNATDQKSEQV